MEMQGRTVLITGSNNGIGKEAAREIARKGAKVIMACRNMETGKSAQEDIIESTGNQNVALKHVDLSSFESIRNFAKDINETEPCLHVLVHNAGIWLSKHETNEAGLELTMATNHFGPFLLTHLLIDLLKKSAPSRIVLVSSIAHHFALPKFSDTNYIPSFLPQINYFNSKFANVAFTRELSRRLEETGVTVNCLHPGLINTGIWSALPPPLNWILNCLKRPFLKTVKEGCETIVYLATSEEVANSTGKYYVDCKKAYMRNRAVDRVETRKIWEVSEKVALMHGDTKIY